jgi:hypothetical protein
MAQVKVEWIISSNLTTEGALVLPISAEIVTGSTTVQGLSSAAPTPSIGTYGFVAKVTALDLNAYVNIGLTPVASSTSGILLSIGKPVYIMATPGYFVAVKEATGADIAVVGGVASSVTVTNTGFAINGTLPAFAATPAVTISGTLPAFTSTPAVSISGTLPAFASTPAVSISGTPAVSISGTLPAFAATPAVSISGTLPAFASTPAVSISGTPAVSISGTLPAFAATPTVNLGTLNGSALDGTDGTSISQPTGGVGIRGWLSGIYKAITSTLTVAQVTTTPVLKSGLTTTVSQVVGATAVLSGYFVYNPNASVAYIQIFDSATAGAVTLGTTTPKWSIGIPPSTGANLSNLHMSFASGIQVAATTTATGSTAPATALDANFSYR